MVATALALGALGLFALFLPDAVPGGDVSPAASVPVQLFGGGLLGFAALNWMGRGAIYGGIYGRPIVVANLALGTIAGGTLVSAVSDGRLPSWAWAPAILFLLHAVGFFLVMRQPPWEAKGRGDQDAE